MLTLKQHMLAASLLMACASTTFAANDAVLKVTGKLIPGACQIESPNTVDFGDVNVENVQRNSGGANTIGSQSVGLVIMCPYDMPIAISAVDNMSGTVANVSGSYANGAAFGLGLTKGGNKIGGYILEFEGDHNGDYLTRPAAGGDWYKNSGPLKAGDFYTQSDARGSVNPSAAPTHIYNLNVTAYMDAVKNLDLADGVELNGQATFQITYL